MDYVIVNRGHVLGLGPPLDGQWLAEYDPNAHGGRGHARWTTDPAQAMRFESAAAAYEKWSEIPAVDPLRPDGKPNRPLTAYTVEIGRL